MDETSASGSSGGKDSDDIQEFLRLLEALFKGRRCYLGQYPEAKEGGAFPGSLSPRDLKAK